MAVVTMPVDLLVGGAMPGQARYDIVEQSDSNGVQATRLLGPPRWKWQLRSLDNMSLGKAGQWESIVYSLRGRVNHLAVWDPMRPVPVGTARGSMRLLNAVAAGATSMTLVGGTAGTLLTADWLQVGSGLGSSQTVKLVADTVSSPAVSTVFAWDNSGVFVWTNGGTFVWTDEGTLTVTFEAPLRAAYARDTVVTWSYPVTYCKAQNDSQQSSYVPGFIGQGGYSLDLLEAFS
jgi:hypothetical protein